MREKGFNLLLEAIPQVIKERQNVHFNFMCFEANDLLMDKDFAKVYQDYSNYISFIPSTNDVLPAYQHSDFIAAPSYYREGISNVLLESLASARPIITTMDNYGCKETLLDGVNGFGVKSNDLNSLISALINASKLSKDEIYEMGLKGREFVEKHFDRQMVIKTYLEVIDKIKKEMVKE